MNLGMTNMYIKNLIHFSLSVTNPADYTYNVLSIEYIRMIVIQIKKKWLKMFITKYLKYSIKQSQAID